MVENVWSGIGLFGSPDPIVRDRSLESMRCNQRQGFPTLFTYFLVTTPTPKPEIPLTRTSAPSIHHDPSYVWW